jgi:hypothetical protein
MARPLEADGLRAGNRYCILPTALPSGCDPLDPFYADRPEAERLKAAKGISR